jgi:hypothetical protein
MKYILIIEKDPVIYCDTALCLWDHGWSPLPYCPSFELAAYLYQQEKPELILIIHPHPSPADQPFHWPSRQTIWLEKPFCHFQVLDLVGSGHALTLPNTCIH